MAYELIKIPGATADVFSVEAAESDANREVYCKVKNKDNTYFSVNLRATGNSEGEALLHNSPAASASGKQIVTAEWVRNLINTSGSVPIGCILPWASNNINGIPSGFLLCNGQAVSRTTYSSLYNRIGTSFGSGDGSTTFNIPDMNDRVLWGKNGNSQLGYVSAGLPNIVGSFSADDSQIGQVNHGWLPTGCFYGERKGSYDMTSTSSTSAGGGLMHLNASRSSGIYGASSTVQPPAVKTLFIIRAI